MTSVSGKTDSDFIFKPDFASKAEAFFTSPSSNKIYFEETENDLFLSFITTFNVKITCKKLSVFDSTGKRTCNIAKCNACGQTSIKVYDADMELEKIFTFLNSSTTSNSIASEEISCKINDRRGIFDLFYDKKIFMLSLYGNGILESNAFPTKETFNPGCYSDYTDNFMELNKHRQVIFQTRECLVNRFTASDLVNK